MKFAGSLPLIWTMISLAFIGMPMAWSVESQAVTVVRVDGGLRLSVAGQLGGVTVPITVQLDHIALLGDPQFSRQVIEEFCPPGSQIILRHDGPDFPSDEFGVVHVEILRDLERNLDPTEARNGPLKAGSIRCSLQAQLIRAGWAQPLRDARGVPPDLAQQFQSAEREAKARKLGFHSLPHPAGSDPVPRTPVIDSAPVRIDPAPPAAPARNPF